MNAQKIILSFSHKILDICVLLCGVLAGRQYGEYLKELPDYGGKKTSHALAIYGSIVIFSLYPLLPDHPPAEELQELVTSLFMSGFVKLGKIFDLNRSFDMWLIDKVFQGVGKGTASCTRSIRCASAMYPSRTTRKTCRAIPFCAVPKCGICEKARSDAGAAAFLQFRLLGNEPTSRHLAPPRHLRERRQMRLLRGRV